MTARRTLRRCGLAVLVLALVFGAGAPLAAGLTAPAPKARLRLDCPGLRDHPPAARPGPWLARCGLVRGA